MIPALTRHYRGVFFKSDQRARTGSDNHKVQPCPTPRSLRKQKQTAVSSRSTGNVTHAMVNDSNGEKATNSSN